MDKSEETCRCGGVCGIPRDPTPFEVQSAQSRAEVKAAAEANRKAAVKERTKQVVNEMLLAKLPVAVKDRTYYYRELGEMCIDGWGNPTITYINEPIDAYPTRPTIAQVLYILAVSKPDEQKHILAQLNNIILMGLMDYIEITMYLYPERKNMCSSILSLLTLSK